MIRRCAGERNALQLVERRVGRRKVDLGQRQAAVDQLRAGPDRRRAGGPAASRAAAAARGAPGAAASWSSGSRSFHRPARSARCESSRRLRRPGRPLSGLRTAGSAFADRATSARAFRTESRAGARWNTSARNGWLNQIARSEPVASRSRTSKILKRGRRVGRTPEPTTSPTTDAAVPGRSEEMVLKLPRSS